MHSAQEQRLPARLRRLLQHPVTDHVVAGLILLSIVLLVLEATWPASLALHVLGYTILLLFLVELILRFVATSSKSVFLRNYWIDMLSLLPLVLPGLEILRIMRLLRLFRLGPLLLQSNRRFGRIYRQTTRQQMTILSIILVVVMAGTLVMKELEHGPGFNDLYDTFWYSLLSLIAGEPLWPSPPETLMGKLFTLVITIGGLTVFALFTGTVSAIVAERLEKGSRTGIMDLEELADHIIVCGWNRSGRVLLEEIHANPSMHHKAVVVVAENRPEFNEAIDMNPRILFLEGDYTTIATLNKAKVALASTAILLADRSVPNRSDQDRDARTILAALIIEKLHPGIFTVAELLSRNNEVHLRLAGIEEVVIADEYSATILATSSRVRGVTEIVDEIFSNKYGNQIYKREVPPDWNGITFLELQQKVKASHDALVIAIERAPEKKGAQSADVGTPYSRTMTNPPADYKIQSGDRLIVLAKADPKW